MTEFSGQSGKISYLVKDRQLFHPHFSIKPDIPEETFPHTEGLHNSSMEKESHLGHADIL